MWTYLTIAALIAATAVARPQEDAPPPTAVASTGPSQPPVEIVSQTDVINPDGSFNYSYELSNGIRVQESGFVKKDPNVAARSGDADDENSGDINVAQGSFSYTAPDGTVISLTYTADENGFQPQGDHLPTSPPIPEAIARALSAAPPEAEGVAPTAFAAEPPTASES
ncbi:endocuticle structural glycoprotein ABD-4 [Anabrus simplex]|uniref:endocuticle structural glycoprotein ABD-4 n=1 Tax=Anabrus simplex TaxID=316456 RepID=UPI0034DD442D